MFIHSFVQQTFLKTLLMLGTDTEMIDVVLTFKEPKTFGGRWVIIKKPQTSAVFTVCQALF